MVVCALARLERVGEQREERDDHGDVDLVRARVRGRVRARVRARARARLRARVRVRVRVRVRCAWRGPS